MKTKIKISGVIVQGITGVFEGQHTFLKHLDRSNFSDGGVYDAGYGISYLFIAEHTIEVDVVLPNVKQAQLKALEVQENALREKFAGDMMNIKVQRSKLMALTNEVAE